MTPEERAELAYCERKECIADHIRWAEREARAAALEEAARVAENAIDDASSEEGAIEANVAHYIAAAIRALKGTKE